MLLSGPPEAMVAGASATSRTQSPIVTGTSVLAVKYAGGVMMLCDTLGSYGSLARFTDVRRISTFGADCLVGASGEYSDLTHLREMLAHKEREDRTSADDYTMSPGAVYNFLRAQLHARRNKFNPLWNSVVVAGHRGGEAFLGTVSMIGTAFEEEFVATGFGGHLAIPIMRKHWRADLTEGEARALLETCARVCYYRDCRTINKLTLAKVDDTGAVVSDPYSLETKWDYRSFVDPKAGAEFGGSW